MNLLCQNMKSNAANMKMILQIFIEFRPTPEQFDTFIKLAFDGERMIFDGVFLPLARILKEIHGKKNIWDLFDYKVFGDRESDFFEPTIKK